MEIDLSDITRTFEDIHKNRYSRHDPQDRLAPSVFQYDYLNLSSLVSDVRQLILDIRPFSLNMRPALALDVGCGKSPYRNLIEAQGFTLKTLDIDDSNHPDYIGSIENTGLPENSFYLALCTQVIEHLADPISGLGEIFRILRPGGYLILTAPHVWFYHPHPSDNWRFTQEGLPRLVRAVGFEPKKLLSQGGSVLCCFQIMNFLLFGILGKIGGPIYAASNILARLGDKMIRNSLFCMNFAVLAQKPDNCDTAIIGNQY